MAEVDGTLHIALGALGASVAAHGYVRALRRFGLDPESVRLAWSAAMALGLVLSRLAFGLERELPWAEVLRPNAGGFVLYGALPAIGVVPLWLRLRGVEARPYLDHAAPWILVGLATGRIGCWVAGCCGGISAHGTTVPVPLFAAVFNATLGWALYTRLQRGSVDGTAALALLAHASGRTLLDPFRAQSITQSGAALPLAAYGLLRFWQSRRRERAP